MALNTQRKQAQITFSPTLYQLGEALARTRGLSFSEFLRHLLVKEIEDKDPEIMRMQVVADKSLKEYQEGKGTTLKTPEDIEKYLK